MSDPLSIHCSYCGSITGQLCMTSSGRICQPHVRRIRLARAVEANNDPALDEHFPKTGPCGICGVPGLHQRHRVIDAIADALAAEPGSADELAVEYGVTPGAVMAVGEWRKRWGL